MADAMMMFLGEAHGVNWYWAQPGEFENPGVYYWDGVKNVLCVPHLAAAPEAPAQLPRGECFTNGNICARCGHPEFIEAPAQPIPAPWREAVKVAREALEGVASMSRCGQLDEFIGEPWLNAVHAALAQLDALEGGE